MRDQERGDKAVTYSENVIMAFLNCNSVTEVAKKTGLGRTTIHKYKRDPELQRILAERREQMMQCALDTMRGQLQPAAEKLIEIIQDPETPKQTAVNAISTLFATMKSMTELTEFGKRIAALEEQAGQIDALWNKIGGAV
jgi:hypothetical protein